jgi:hypothetical protein
MVFVQLRQFCKKCKVGNYNKKMRTLLDKIEENIKFVERERASLSIKLSQTRDIQDWEQQLRSKGRFLGPVGSPNSFILASFLISILSHNSFENQ